MWNVTTHVGRLLRNILLSEELYPEFAAYFEGLSFDELEELAASFNRKSRRLAWLSPLLHFVRRRS